MEHKKDDPVDTPNFELKSDLDDPVDDPSFEEDSYNED